MAYVLTLKELGLSLDKTSVQLRRLARLPGFPLPVGKGPNNENRYLRVEIVTWLVQTDRAKLAERLLER